MSDARILHFFGGKGGVGKSTLAGAFALNLSEKLPEEKILLLSLDSMKSLSDLLRKRLAGKPAKVAAGKGAGDEDLALIDDERILYFARGSRFLDLYGLLVREEVAALLADVRGVVDGEPFCSFLIHVPLHCIHVTTCGPP